MVKTALLSLLKPYPKVDELDMILETPCARADVVVKLTPPSCGEARPRGGRL